MISVVLISVISIGYVIFSSPYNQFSVVAQDNSKPKKVGEHIPGSNILETAGDTLDPISLSRQRQSGSRSYEIFTRIQLW